MNIDVMKQALEALERGETKLRYEAITALRAAIERIHTSVSANTHQQPVAWAVELPNGTRKPLYTAPHQPLTDEEMKPLIQKAMMYYGHNPDHWTLTAGAGFCILARAIEAKLKEKNSP